jgi:invasion protein IalB
MMVVLKTLALTAVVAVVVSAGAAPAQAKPEKGKVFDNWTVNCEAAPDGKSERCFVGQDQAIKESGQHLIRVAIGYFGANGEMSMVVTLPLGINLVVGAAYRLDEREQIPIRILNCTPQGCIGVIPIDSATVAAFKSGKALNFGVMPFGSDKTLSIAVPLKGFAESFATLK